MGTHNLHYFRGYNPYIGGLKPSFFMVLGSKGSCYPRENGHIPVKIDGTLKKKGPVSRDVG